MVETGWLLELEKTILYAALVDSWARNLRGLGLLGYSQKAFLHTKTNWLFMVGGTTGFAGNRTKCQRPESSRRFATFLK